MIDDSLDEYLLKEICTLNEMLAPLVSSYRLSVGAAEELNRIALAHRRDVVDAIDRADNMGHLVDKVQRTLNKYMRRYFSELDYKLEYIDEIHEKAVMRKKLEYKLNKLSEEKKEDL